MFRYVLATTILAATISMVGCVGGPGCGVNQCCDGYVGGGCDAGPFDCWHGWRRGLTCGAGCGEVYCDEWCSTPPDCDDPCCFDYPCHSGCGLECCGCGVDGCRGACNIRPVRRVAGFIGGLYGTRCCDDCGYGYDDCCCDDPYSGYGSGCDCDSCGCDGGVYYGGDCGPGGCNVPQRTYPGPAVNQGLEEISQYPGGVCPDGNCKISDRGRRVAPSQRTSVARQQMLSRQAHNMPMANSASLRAGLPLPRNTDRGSRVSQGPSSFQR